MKAWLVKRQKQHVEDIEVGNGSGFLKYGSLQGSIVGFVWDIAVDCSSIYLSLETLPNLDYTGNSRKVARSLKNAEQWWWWWWCSDALPYPYSAPKAHIYKTQRRRSMRSLVSYWIHVTNVLAILHWLRLPERVNFKLALMAYRVQHGMAPVSQQGVGYLNQLVPISDLPGRRRLRSSSTLELFVRSHRLTTIGRRSFPVAAATVWNTFPAHAQSSPSICNLSPTA